MSQFLDKRRQLIRRQRSIAIAVTFCHPRREIIATDEHLQGASPPDKPWQSLRRAAARNKPNRHLRLAEDRFADGSKTHVHGQRDLTASAPSPPLDFGNGDLGHVPEPLADRLCKTKAARMGHRFGSGSNPAQTGVSYKEIRKRALQDHNPDALIGLELPAEFVEFLRQNFIKKIYRRVIDADECDSGIKPEPETFVVRVSHRGGSIWVRTRASALRGRRDSLADTGDVAGARCGRRVPPAAADKIDQTGNILIAQSPSEGGHRELSRRLRRAWRLRTGEHDRNQ